MEEWRTQSRSPSFTSMSRRVALSAKRVSTTSLSIPKWDDTRVSPFAPFLNPHARASKSHHWHCFIAFICFIPVRFFSLSLYFLIDIEIGERASGVDPFADLLLLRESRRRRRRRGFHLFEPERRTRPPVAKCICRRNRPSVRHACSLLRFPPAATKRLGSPSLLCPSFPLFSVLCLCLPSPRTAPSKAFAAAAAI